ncbi:hypothetical protein AgCh_004909 [Apium graveolens]
MNSDEFSNLIGHNYVALPHLLDLPAINQNLFLDEAAHNSKWAPNTARRIQEETHLILDGITKSSDSVTNRGNSKPTSPVLEDLHVNFTIRNGILTIRVPMDNVVDSNSPTEQLSNDVNQKKVVGLPLKFDDNTARFEPLKYAQMQVMLSYSSSRPDFLWVHVQDEYGEEDLMKVNFLYHQLPYSNSHCRDFGHSFSRCIHNPNIVKPTPRTRPTTTYGDAKVHKTKKHSTAYQLEHIDVAQEKDQQQQEPLVFDVDQTLADVQASIAKDIENGDDLEAFD